MLNPEGVIVVPKSILAAAAKNCTTLEYGGDINPKSYTVRI
jgi:hypothetical protein